MSEETEQRQDLIREQSLLMTAGILITAGVAFGTALFALRSVALPFVMALLLTYIVTPVVDYLEMRLRAPRGVALVVTMLIGIGLFLGLSLLVVQSVVGLEANADLYQNKVTEFGTTVVGWLDGVGVPVDQASIVGELQKLPVRELATEALGSLAAFGGNVALTLIFFIFLVVGKSPWEGKGGIWEEIDRSVNRYLRTKLVTSAAIGATFGGVLLGFGVDLAFVFGVLAFLLNFIPTIGSILAVLLTLPLIFVTLDPLLGLGVVGILVLVQNVIGNGLEPKLMGAGLDLHPATILIGLGLWGAIWGVIGMLLSAPLMAILRVVFKRYETTRPVAELLAGRVGDQARRTSVSL
ncbi:MAG: hypothetical protein CSA66_04815 [Proteobacteria bacterium]|nr:MAG: hypothetical protein CSA66_04815 [Pseudomonadota bacterium]